MNDRFLLFLSHLFTGFLAAVGCTANANELSFLINDPDYIVFLEVSFYVGHTNQ